MRADRAPGATVGVNARGGAVLDTRQIAEIWKLLANLSQLPGQVEVVAIADAMEQIDRPCMAVLESVLHQADQRAEPAVPAGENESPMRIADLIG